MDQKQFEQLFSNTMQELHQLLVVKGGEYAGSDDRLANFKRGGALTGVKPLTVLFIYLAKHYDAVSTYVRDKQVGIDRPRSEEIEGRLDDLMNYCILAKAIIAEERMRSMTVDTASVVKQTIPSYSGQPYADPQTKPR